MIEPLGGIGKIIQYSGSHNESALRKPFQDLLEQYARARNLELIAELDYRTGAVVYSDGTLKDVLPRDDEDHRRDEPETPGF